MNAYGRVHVGLIENTAQELARRHRICAGRPEPLSSLERVVEMSGWLEFAQQRLSKPEASVAKAAEWFLDNSYLVQRAIRQIQEDLPAAFYTQLPVLEGPNGPGLPRIYAVACGMIDVANLQVTPALIVRFLNALRTPCRPVASRRRLEERGHCGLEVLRGLNRAARAPQWLLERAQAQQHRKSPELREI